MNSPVVRPAPSGAAVAPGAASPIKVFVVDDSAIVRQALMHLLQGDSSIELLGSAPNPSWPRP